MKEKLFIVEEKDKRDKYLFDYLKNEGFDVVKYGACCNYNDYNQLVYVMSLTSDVKKETILSLKEKSKLFARDLSTDAINAAKGLEIDYYNYFSDEEFIFKNAYLTAEGALSYIIDNTDSSIVFMKVLIIGYGRVGEAVAKVLKDNYFDVSVTNRGHEGLARASLLANDTFLLCDIDKHLFKYSVIVNTVPKLILEGDMLKTINKDCFVLDLASKPGGVDFDALKQLNVKYLHALGIPGKVAPKTAGGFLRDIIKRELRLL